MAEHPTCIEPGFLRRFPWNELAPYVIRLLAAGEALMVGQIASAAGVPRTQVEAPCGPARRVELLHVPGCPSLNTVRAAVEECLNETGIDGVVHEREGAFASPTLLIDGVDVVTGASAQTPGSCRLDLPTRGQILAALGAGAS